VPDYVVSAGTLVPEVHVLSGIRCTGSFSHLLRFAPKGDHRGVGLPEIAHQALSIAGSDVAGVVIVAETVGLVGAALRRAPTGSSTGDIFSHPEVQGWLTFTSERAFAHCLCIAAGVVAKSAAPPLAAFLRPLSEATSLSAHFHAVALSYRPLQQGEIELTETVSALFETATPRGVLHLLMDDRPIAGVGACEFARGACWCAPATVTNGEA